MSFVRSRLVPSVLALAAVSLLAAGCATTSGSPAPTSSAGSASDERTAEDVEAVWLDGGRMIAVVTWGSSTPTCQPLVSDVQADGQRVTLTLADRPEAAEGCDSDLAPRALTVGVPEGLDPRQEVELTVVHGDITAETELDAIDADRMPSGDAGVQDPQTSATWFDDDGIVLLTYGSSSCPPIVEDITLTDAGATVTFATTDRVCTMDFAPRATVILVPEPVDDDAPFMLTLVGDSLDGEVAVLG